MNLQDFSGKSAIHYAAAAGHHLILKQLAGGHRVSAGT